jgi:TolB-like protein/Tfp pilus assembly protein PilF
MSFFQELKRRNVFRVGIAYGLGAWVLLQGADFALDVIGAPNWMVQALVALALLGLPVALVFSWVFEMTPEGLKREVDIDRGQSITPQTGRKLDRVIISLLALAVVVLLADRIISSREPLISITGEETRETPVTASQAADAAIALPSIAVLPFVNMSSDPEQEYFSDGLAEELLNRLAKLGQLRVAARTSSFQFKGQNLDIADIGRQLKVNHILEGSVRRAGSRLRVTAQLIKADDGFHLWSETYEREMDDIFGIQDEISDAITHALKVELGVLGVQGPPTENLAAYQLFLQARHALAKRGIDNMQRAIGLFQQAIDLDPGFARAYSGAAFTWSLMPAYGGAETEVARWHVNELAYRALELNPDNPEPYVAIGRMLGGHDGAVAAARQQFEKAYQLAPNDVDVVNLYGDFLFMIGRTDDAEAMERRAVELDPLAAVHHSDLASVLLARGKKEEALEFARASSRLEPDVVDRSEPLLYALAANGKFTEANQLIDYALEHLSGASRLVNSWRCAVAFHQGDRARLRELLEERLRDHEEVGAGKYSIAAWYIAWLDGGEAAVPMLERALEAEEFALTWPDPFFLPELISRDPGFLAFWEQPGLRELIEARRANWDGEPVGYQRPATWE